MIKQLKTLKPPEFKVMSGKIMVKKTGKMGYSILRLLILLSIGFVILYPLFYMVVTSFESESSFLNSTRIWIPTDLAIKENYSFAMEIMYYGEALISSLKNHVFSALIEVVVCAITAYGFARFKFKGKGIMMVLLFSTIMIPDMMVMIPRMVNYSNLDFLGVGALVYEITGLDLRPNILNTSLSFWLPSVFGIGLRSGILIFIYFQFFKGLPKELEEAAYVDGAGPVRTFVSIAIPSSTVVILTVTVFALIWHWNDSFLSGMYLKDDYPLAMRLELMPTTLFNRGILASIGNPQAMAYQMASCVLFILPMLIFYMIIQRWFIESIDRVGITG